MSKKYITDVIKIDGQLLDGNGSAGTSGQILSSTGTATDWISLSEISGVDGTGTANYVAKWSDTDTITNSVIYDDGTNVGIAITNPLAALHAGVQNAASITTKEFRLESTTSSGFGGGSIVNLYTSQLGFSGVYFGDSATYSSQPARIEFLDVSNSLNYDSTQYHLWKVLGSTKMTINNDNVGIGTTSPSNKLHVANGNILVDGGGIRQINLESSNSEVRFGLKGNNGNQFRFVSDGTHIKLNDATKERIKITNAGDITFGGRDSGGNQATWMTLKDQTGNVGIGTTNPNYRLVTYKNNTNYNAFFTGGNGTKGVGIGYDNTTPVIQGLAYNSDTTYYDLSLQPSGGNVGIGTNSPEANLHIKINDSGATPISQQHLILENNSATGIGILTPSTTSGYLFFGDNNDAQRGFISYSHINDSMSFKVSGSERMRIDSSGNVGIGTTSPNNELEILGSNSPRISLRTSSETIGEALELGFQIGTGANASSNTVGLIKSVITQADPSSLIGDLEFQTNSGDSAGTKMTIKGGGNVGIGTTAPYGKLHVFDSATGAAGMTVHNNLEASGNSAALWFKVAGSSSDYRKGAILFVNNGTGYGRGDFYFASNTSTSSSSIASISDTKMVIKNSGNVGIGTTSPATALDVYGTSDTYLTVRHGGGGYNAGIRMYGGSAGISHIWHDDSETNPPGIRFGTSADTATAPTTQMYIKGSDGNVGIGTASPVARLDVSGTAQMDTGITEGIHYVGTGVQHWGDGGTGIDFPSNDTIDLLTTSSSRVRIDSNGNVGIGTTSPSGKLEVNTGSSVAYFTRTAGDDGLLNPVVAIAVDSSRGLIAASGDSLSFRVRAIGTSNPFGGNTVMSLLPSGNVGIGTTLPSSPLMFGKSVYGNFDSENFYRIKLQDQGGILNDVGIGQTASGNMGFNITSGSAFIFNNGTSGEIARFNGTGLGIGTTSPDYKLNIVDNQASDYVGLFIANSRAYGSGQGAYGSSLWLGKEESGANQPMGGITARPNSEDNSTEGHMTFNTRASGSLNERMRITNTGNVGIGTTSPGEKLDVVGRVRGERFRTTTGGDASFAAYYFSGDSDTGTFQPANNMLGITTAGTERMRITDAGNVGIGVTSPQVKLHVANGTLRTWAPTSGTTAIFESTQSSRSFITITGANESELWFGNAAIQAKGRVRYENNNDMMEFWTNENPRMYINSTGNVGIGADSPSEKLDVYDGVIIQDTDPAAFGQSTGKFYLKGKTAYNLGGTLTVYPSTWRQQVEGVGVFSGSSYLTIGCSENGGAYSEKLRINSSNGNVGIGTNSPSQKLDVVGSIEVSDGIYIGGTGTANKLDDYEEGTFTPTLVTSGTDTNPITKQGRYTKIGNLVTVTIMISVTIDEFTTLSISECSNLPFTIRNESSFAGIRLRGVAEYDNATTDAFEVYCEGLEGTLRLFFRKGNSSIALESDSDNEVMAQITYEVE